MNVPHVRRRLNRWDVFEDSVADTDYSNDRSRNEAEPPRSNDDGTNEDVNCENQCGLGEKPIGICLQMPRPRKENMNEAYRATC